jgi:hypothetical protein
MAAGDILGITAGIGAIATILGTGMAAGVVTGVAIVPVGIGAEALEVVQAMEHVGWQVVSEVLFNPMAVESTDLTMDSVKLMVPEQG